VLVCALGDLLLDVVVRLDGRLAPGDDTTARTRTGAGGQAANVAAWAAALGGRGRYLGKRAADAAGGLVAAELAAGGVDVEGPVASGRTGVVISLVDPRGARTMVSDPGVSPELRPEEIERGWLEGWRTLHLSGYSLVREPIGAAAERAAALAHDAGLDVSIDVSSAAAVRAFGAERLRDRLVAIAPDTLFATEAERDAIGADLRASTWVLKRGAAGCIFARDGVYVELPAAEVEVVDSTGAGDALAAGFLLGGPLDAAARRAMRAAARCVSKLGSMPW
jgi:ribokinase